MTADTKEPVVWIVDRQQWLRALLRAELIERGYEVVGLVGVNEALSAFRHPLYGRPQVIIVELRDLADGEEKVLALVELEIPTIFLAGAAEEHRAVLGERWWTVSLRRPFTIGRVVEEVEKQVEILKAQRVEGA